MTIKECYDAMGADYQNIVEKIFITSDKCLCDTMMCIRK